MSERDATKSKILNLGRAIETIQSAVKYSEEGKKNVPLNFQLSMLQIDQEMISKLKGRMHLDVGCGNGALVNHLRAHGVESDGIDSEAPEDEHFIRRRIASTGKGISSRGIPRPNDTYDLITVFQNPVFNYAFSDVLATLLQKAVNQGDISSDVHFEMSLEAQSIVGEMIRTIKPGSPIIVFPDMVRVEEVMGFALKVDKVSVERKKLKDRRVVRSYLDWELKGIPDKMMDFFDSCTILRKEAC